MLNQSKGIVPQLVDQYNVLIEHNLCQTINLVEFRDNRSNSVINEVIDQAISSSIKATVDKYVQHRQSDSALVINVRKEKTIRLLHQSNEQVLGLFNHTIHHQEIVFLYARLYFNVQTDS